jgi:hypothetical protein
MLILEFQSRIGAEESIVIMMKGQGGHPWLPNNKDMHVAHLDRFATTEKL